SGRLDLRLALEIVAQVAAGLAAVHKQNLVHRDIKPSNIMVKLEGGGALMAKIIDLGLAKFVSEPGSQSKISARGGFARDTRVSESGAIRRSWRGHPLGALGDGDRPNAIPRSFC